MDMNGKFGLYYNGTTGKWEIRKGGSGSKLPAFCAYFEGTPSSARGLEIEVGDGTTNIDAFENVEEEANGPVYNLMGIQTNAPQKGIYIKNGKKFIAK